MWEVILTRDKVALVDDEDYQLVQPFNWCAIDNHGRTWYAKANVNGIDTLMHKLLLPEPEQVDHINGDGLDNRRNNLRACSISQNAMNRQKRVGTTSKYKGVYWNEANQSWRVYIYVSQRAVNLGSYANEESAAEAYNKAALEHFGEFAKLNCFE